jgi:hypothetical protein
LGAGVVLDTCEDPLGDVPPALRREHNCAESGARIAGVRPAVRPADAARASHGLTTPVVRGWGGGLWRRASGPHAPTGSNVAAPATRRQACNRSATDSGRAATAPQPRDRRTDANTRESRTAKARSFGPFRPCSRAFPIREPIGANGSTWLRHRRFECPATALQHTYPTRSRGSRPSSRLYAMLNARTSRPRTEIRSGLKRCLRPRPPGEPRPCLVQSNRERRLKVLDAVGHRFAAKP